MRHFWRVRGHGNEARWRLEEAFERARRVEPPLRARIFYETAVMRMSAGDYDGARAAWLEALEIEREVGNAMAVARIHAELAALWNAAGDPQTSIDYGTVAVELFGEHEEFLRLIVLGNLAESYEQTGDLVRARSTALEVLEAQRRIGDRDGVAYMSFALASIAFAQGDLAESHRRLIECLTVSGEVGFVELTGYALGLAADLAVALGLPEDAAVLLGASQESFSRSGGTPQVHEAERHARVAAAVEEGLDDADEALARGHGLRQEQAVGLAIALDARRD